TAFGGEELRRGAQLRRDVIEEFGAAVNHDEPVAALPPRGDVRRHRVMRERSSAPDLEHNRHRAHAGCNPGKRRPRVSSWPLIRFMHCTAEPAAPFMRLSIAAMTTT